MAMTDKKRKTDADWKKKNLKTAGCKLYLGDYEKFKNYAESQGKSVQKIMKEFVASCIGPLERRTAAGPDDDGSDPGDPGE